MAVICFYQLQNVGKTSLSQHVNEREAVNIFLNDNLMQALLEILVKVYRFFEESDKSLLQTLKQLTYKDCIIIEEH